MLVRKLFCVLLSALLILGLTACGSSAPKENAAMDMYAPEAPAEMESGLQKAEESVTTSLPADRKLIRTITIDAETEDLTTLTEELNARITELGGYVESKNLRNGSSYSGYVTRTLSMTVRIPLEKADAFVNRVSEKSNIVSSTEAVDDVTLKYVDTESHVKALETEQERLLALLEKAETLKDILTLEDKLAEVRYQLERYASQLRNLDNQVTYATIHLTVTEVKEYTPIIEEEPTVWEKISEGFGRSISDIWEGLTNLFIWIVVNSPYLLILGGIGAVVYIKCFRWRIPRRRRTPPKEKTE